MNQKEETIMSEPIPIETLTPGEARYQTAFVDALKQTIQKKTRMYPMPEPVGKVEEITITVSAGQIAGRVYTPSGSGPFPVIVYYHGGEFRPLLRESASLALST